MGAKSYERSLRRPLSLRAGHTQVHKVKAAFASLIKRDDPGFRPRFVERHKPDRARQLEPARPRAAGIEQHCSTEHTLVWPVRVAEDDDMRAHSLNQSLIILFELVRFAKAVPYHHLLPG